MNITNGATVGSSFFLFMGGAWQIELKFSFKKTLRTLMVTATGLEEDLLGYSDAFHYHPDINDSPRWTCVDDYEKGPHFHFYCKTARKMLNLQLQMLE